MNTLGGRTEAFLLSCLIFALVSAAPQDQSAATQQGKGSKRQTFSGRVIDGFGRPVPGVKVTVPPDSKSQQKTPRLVLQTGDSGLYEGSISDSKDLVWIAFEKEGYDNLSVIAVIGSEIILNRKVDWSKAADLPYCEGEELDRGLTDLLASAEWTKLPKDGKLIEFLFKGQDKFQPALRRLITDAHIGAKSRDWLDVLAAPGDNDLFPNGRKYAPKDEVQEADLIEALKVTASHRNFFSSMPEPFISIDLITLTQGLDRALIQCGINRVAMTGITWQFVFRKVGNHWKLLSVTEVGRS